MVSFYPGPSQVHEKVPKWVKSAYEEGILGANHRSSRFQHLMKSVYHELHTKLQIPNDYSIVFTSSATECWEIIAQSFIQETSFHLYNGAFGEKWHRYTKPLVGHAVGYEFDYQEPLDLDQIIIPEDIELLCITQNETSNATQISSERMAMLRSKYPDTLIAVDATSSMGGILLDFSQADIWFASVQKCFGLPAGMGILICSPSAAARAEEIHEYDHYNSWLFMRSHAENHQTHITPNVLDIYLLDQVLKDRKGISSIHSKTVERYEHWTSFWEKQPQVRSLIQSSEAQSFTVIGIEGEPESIKSYHKKAKDAGFWLGKGYGSWKKNTFRIANFPAISKEHIEALQEALRA